jgi:outer membrane receptor protein involved in Fe transport
MNTGNTVSPATRRSAIGFLIVLIVMATTTGTTLGAQGGTGQISGVVRDQQGGVLPGVTVTLRNQETGVTRTATSDNDGRYRFPALAPGRYTLRSELAGFATIEAPDLAVTIGLEVSQDLGMKIQAVAETVTVRAASPVVDTTKSEVSGVITQQQIETLPINSRQYLSLALLIPGTGLDATRSFFPTVNIGGSLTFNSTTNLVDGMYNVMVEDGEPRQSLPEDAVQEFKVSSAQYNAEFGLATGGVLQVATKSGTNSVHGTAFEYFRDKTLNARGVFEAQKPAFRRNQFGGSVGGPIVQNRMHFFATAERTRTDQFYTVTTGLPQFYSSVEGTFKQPLTTDLYLGRYDWQINNAQNLFARYAQEGEFLTCQGCGGTTASTAGYDEDVPRRSLVVAHTWIRGTRQLNDLRVQVATAAYYITPAGTEPWEQVGVFPAERTGRLSRSYRFPSLTYGSSNDQVGPESRYQLKDTYTITSAQHELKLGADISVMKYQYDTVGNLGGSYTFSQDQPFNPADPASIARLTSAATFAASFPPVTTKHPSKYYVGFVQDDWKLRSNVTLNLGLRYERLYGNANEDLDPAMFSTPIPFIDVSARGDKNNLAPRTGLAWDVRGDGASVVRAGWGVYYGNIRMLANLGEFRNLQQFSVSLSQPAYPDPYRGQNPQQFITTAAPNIQVTSNDFKQPMANQANVGISQRLSSEFAIHVDAVYNRTRDDYKTVDINPRDLVTGLRPLPQWARIDQTQSNSDLKYRAIYSKLEKRFSHRHQFLVSYTWTRSTDNAPLARYLDPFNHTIDFGTSNGERRHAVVASGSVLLPYEITVGAVWTARSQLPWSALAGRDLNGDTFNTDLVPGTSRNSGSRDLNLSAVNTYRAANGLAAVADSQIDSSALSIADIRVSKSVKLHGAVKLDLMLQVFNVLNKRNLQDQYGSGRVTNALSASFGRILSARPMAQGEVAAKLVW